MTIITYFRPCLFQLARHASSSWPVSVDLIRLQSAANGWSLVHIVLHATEGQSGWSLKGSVVALGRLLVGLGQHWYSVTFISQGQSQSQTVPWPPS